MWNKLVVIMFKFDWYDDDSVFNFEVDLCGINW
jgi:hypothetical protein